MKITKSFAPVSITLTFETQEELTLAWRVLWLDATIPKTVSREMSKHFGTSEEKVKQKIHTGMCQLREQLT